jgi:hypothetical protein
MAEIQSVIREKADGSHEPSSLQIDSVYEKNVEVTGDADYSRATKKTEPREIALVRKLDLRIMPILWEVYFMNYVSVVPTRSMRQED